MGVLMTQLNPNTNNIPLLKKNIGKFFQKNPYASKIKLTEENNKIKLKKLIHVSSQPNFEIQPKLRTAFNILNSKEHSLIIINKRLNGFNWTQHEKIWGKLPEVRTDEESRMIKTKLAEYDKINSFR